MALTCFMCVVLLAVYGAIAHAKQNASEKIGRLNSIKEVSPSQQEELNQLQLQKSELEQRWNLLSSLRSTPSPEEIFFAIDKAITDLDVWFTNLQFERSEQLTNQKSEVNTGYFIIVSAGDNENSLSIGTKLIISGGAKNHSTLSRFVKKLLAQAPVLDAKVLETSTRQEKKHLFTNFTIEIVVNQNKAG